VEFKVTVFNIDRISKHKHWRVNYTTIKLLLTLPH